MRKVTLHSWQYPHWFNPNDRRKLLGFYIARQEVVISTDERYDNITLEKLQKQNGVKDGSFLILISDDCKDRSQLVVWSGRDWFLFEKAFDQKASSLKEAEFLFHSDFEGDEITTDIYWCVVCNKALPKIDGVIIHDDIPHPESMTFDEEDNPQ